MTELKQLQEQVGRLVKKVKLLEAVMKAVSPFLAEPLDYMPDWQSFNQYTTAGDCRELNKVYHEARKEMDEFQKREEG